MQDRTSCGTMPVPMDDAGGDSSLFGSHEFRDDADGMVQYWPGVEDGCIIIWKNGYQTSAT